MDQNRIPYPGGFFPGDQVHVVDGTFVGVTGKVVTPEEGRAVGGEASVLSRPKGLVWVVLTMFGRSFSVLLEPSQIRRAGGEDQGKL